MRRNHLLIQVAIFALVSITSTIVRAESANVLADNHPAEALTRPALGNADSSQLLTMEIRFELHNTVELDRLLEEQQDQSSSKYHKWLKTGEFDQRFGPRPQDVKAVANWLAGEGFAVESAADGYIRFTGDVGHAQRSFAVRIARFGDGATYANVEDPSVPPQFAGLVGAITGLDNMMHATPIGLYRIPSAIVNGDQSFGPQDMRIFYDETVQSGSDGTGSCIAMVGTSAVSAGALNAFNNQFGLPPNDLAQVIAGKNPGLTMDNNQIEAELDVEWSHALAPGASQKLFIASNSDHDPLAEDITKAVKDNTCGAISISFGLCGASNSEFTKVLDTQFKKAAAQGQSVFVSSGDQGAAGLEVMNRMCQASSSRGVNEMSADPFVTSVGGTQSSPTFNNGNDVGYSQEDTWSVGMFTGASGGGVSAIFTKPSYQKGPGVPSDTNRDVPDVALQAGSPGVFLGDTVMGPAGIACCFGGTSLSAPMMAGFVTVIDQQVGGRLGSMNPIYYQLANQQYGAQPVNNGFHDITTGNNNFMSVTGFNAGPAYDQTTGWGSIDFDVFAAAVKKTPPLAGPPLTFPASVSFGAHKVGTPPAKPKVIKLTNPAKNHTTATMSPSAALSNTTDFTITASTCTNGATIPAGKFCSVSVQFNPQTASPTPKTGTLTFTDSASNSPQMVNLTGISK